MPQNVGPRAQAGCPRGPGGEECPGEGGGKGQMGFERRESLMRRALAGKSSQMEVNAAAVRT
eukprot:7016621-Lingulodinium_polyedra.AAC.1